MKNKTENVGWKDSTKLFICENFLKKLRKFLKRKCMKFLRGNF